MYLGTCIQEGLQGTCKYAITRHADNALRPSLSPAACLQMRPHLWQELHCKVAGAEEALPAVQYQVREGRLYTVWGRKVLPRPALQTAPPLLMCCRAKPSDVIDLFNLARVQATDAALVEDLESKLRREGEARLQV